MNNVLEGIIFASSILLFISVLVSRLAAKTGIPTLLIFLGIGMLAGSEGPGGIIFENYPISQAFGTVTIAFILFFGGLDTDIRHLKSVIAPSFILSTLGVLVSAVVIALVISFLTNFTFLEGLLIGAIVSPTDAAAVFAILRSRKISLKNNLDKILELESGSNDVVSFCLMMICITALSKNQNIEFLPALKNFTTEMIVGGGVGFLLGKGLVFVINRANLISEALYPGLPLSGILVGYFIATHFHGSGFLCVYVAGITMGSKNILHKESLKKFYEAMAWLMEIGMFLILGLLVFPQKLLSVAFAGVVIAFFSMFLARPLGVFISLLPFRKITNKQKLFLSWGGLRGAAPIIFAIYPLLNGLPNADKMFNIIFFVVVTSVLIQGITFSKVAKILNVEEEENDGALLDNISEEKSEIMELAISTDSGVIGKKVVELNLPAGTVIVTIEREDGFITPRGSTIIEARDKLQIAIQHSDDFEGVKKAFMIE